MHESNFSGGCLCQKVRYLLTTAPLFVHACHCLTCQTFSNSAFSITAIVLESDLLFESGTLISKEPSPGRLNWLCSCCGGFIYRTASNHPGTALLRPGTLDDVRNLSIDAHIWVKRKHEWLELPNNVPQFDEGYEREEAWSQESLNRLAEKIAGAT